MDFEFTEEQRLLRESLDRLLADSYGFDKRKTYIAETEGFGQAMWKQYAEMGLLGLPFSEEYGGFGGGPNLNGPFVIGGVYTVSLVVDGKTIESKPLRVSDDPEVVLTSVERAMRTETLASYLRWLPSMAQRPASLCAVST